MEAIVLEVKSTATRKIYRVWGGRRREEGKWTRAAESYIFGIWNQNYSFSDEKRWNEPGGMPFSHEEELRTMAGTTRCKEFNLGIMLF
jgi:hypothetical protein